MRPTVLPSSSRPRLSSRCHLPWRTSLSALLSLLNNAKKQQETIKALDANNKQYQQILACLTYRKDLMNVEIARNRAGRNSQSADKKAKTKALFNTASKLA